MLKENPSLEISKYLALRPLSNQTRTNYLYQLMRFLNWCSKEGLTLEQFEPSVFLGYTNEQGWAEGSEMR